MADTSDPTLQQLNALARQIEHLSTQYEQQRQMDATYREQQRQADAAYREEMRNAFHRFELASVQDRGDHKNLVYRVSDLEKQWSDAVAKIVGIVILFFVGIVYAIAQGAGVRLK